MPESPSENSYEVQKSVAGRVAVVDGKEWILLYKVPVDEPNGATMAFYVAAEKAAALPAPTFLIGVPIL